MLTKIKNFIFEQGGFLAQIPVVIVVLICFPIFGENLDGLPVNVNFCFYFWQVLLCFLPVIEHFIYYKYWASYFYDKPWVIYLCYGLMFALLVINMQSFTPPRRF